MSSMSSASNYTWAFSPLVAEFPHTVLPNVALWNVTNGVDLDYQVQISWPLTWNSHHDEEKTAHTMYVLDGNALGMTATEAWRRRAPVEPNQPDSIVVSIGYPVTDSVYAPQRSIDFQPVTPGEPAPPEPGVREGADDFLDFIDGALRPFVHAQFPTVRFGRDALYGHSFGGQFVVYALLRRPRLFDTFLAASPSLNWNDGYILKHTSWLDEAWEKGNCSSNKPALRLAYGDLEQNVVRRRTETDEEFQARKDFHAAFAMTDNIWALYHKLEGKSALRDLVLKEYVGSDHATLGAVALTDGIDYFLDW